MGKGLLSIGCIGSIPSLNVTEPADAAADRALSESGRHALNGMSGGLLPLPKPTIRAVRGMAKFILPPAVVGVTHAFA